MLISTNKFLLGTFKARLIQELYRWLHHLGVHKSGVNPNNFTIYNFVSNGMLTKSNIQITYKLDKGLIVTAILTNICDNQLYRIQKPINIFLVLNK